MNLIDRWKSEKNEILIVIDKNGVKRIISEDADKKTKSELTKAITKAREE